MRIKLIDADNRLNIRFNKVDGIHNFGDDNAYPQLIKSLIGSSVTAKNCVDLNAKYIYGKGFGFDGKSTVVNKNGLTLNQLLRIASKEFSEQNNLFFHVNWNAEYKVKSVSLIPTTDPRIGKIDSTGYNGKFVLYDNWDKSKGKKIDKADFHIIDRFNPLEEVIDAQVEAAGGWSKYKGQILHINSDFSELYSLSDADPVLLDMASEFKASEFKHGGLSNGFFGAKLFLTKPIEDAAEKRDFQQTIKDLKGSKNSGGVLWLEASKDSDDLTEQFIVQDINSNIDDKMFESTEASTARNIRKAFGVPSILIDTDAGDSVFANSGELLKSAKLLHWENKEEERNIISEAFQKLFTLWHEPINPNNDWSIVPIITANENNSNEPNS